MKGRKGKKRSPYKKRAHVESTKPAEEISSLTELVQYLCADASEETKNGKYVLRDGAIDICLGCEMLTKCKYGERMVDMLEAGQPQPLKACVKNPGHHPMARTIGNSMKDFQKAVGGYIEVIQTGINGMVLIVNEEWRINGMKPNIIYRGEVLYGPVLVCGSCEDEFTHMPCGIYGLRALMPELFDLYAWDVNEEEQER